MFAGYKKLIKKEGISIAITLKPMIDTRRWKGELMSFHMRMNDEAHEFKINFV